MCRLARCYEARYGWVTVAVGSQLGSQLGFPSQPLTRRNAAAQRSSRATARDVEGRTGSAVAERLGNIPAAAGTALTGRALTSFDPDTVRNPPAGLAGRRFGRAGQDQQVRIAPGLMIWAGGGRTQRGTDDSSFGQGQDHGVSECSRKGGVTTRPYGQRSLIVHGVVVPGWPRFACAAGRASLPPEIMSTAVFACRGRWAGG
jgi:hypothetical protein